MKSYIEKRGSEWRRWDLHIHTKGTNKADNYSCANIDEYCEILFKKAFEKKVYALGITDYFSIDRYKEVKAFRDSISTNNNFTEDEKVFAENILLLPNVELRMLPATGCSKLMNIHCIFNPEYVSSLDNDFFGSLSFISSGRDYKMNAQGLIALGKASNPSLDEKSAYKAGVDHFAISYDQLHKLFEGNVDLRENTLIVVSNSRNDGNSGLQQHYDMFTGDDSSLDEVRRAIYYLSDAIFSGNPRDVDYFLGKGPDSKEKLITNIRSLKPCIHGSDAHEENKMFEPDDHRYCWIKADLTFNGLKQILYEPEERVKIQELKPEEKKAYHIIESITLNEPNFWEEVIPLNQNLNTIIGGRSTGKSTLLAVIAKTIDNTIILKGEKQEQFVNNHLSTVTIKWANEVTMQTHDIEYYRQGYLYDIANSPDDINKLVGRIIKESEHGHLLTAYRSERDDNQKALSHDLLDLFQNQRLLHSTALKSKEAGNRPGIEAEIKRLMSQMEEISKQSGMTEEELVQFKNIEDLISNKKAEIEKCNKDIEIFKRVEIMTPMNMNFPNESGIVNLSDINSNQTAFREEYEKVVRETENKLSLMGSKYRVATESSLKKLTEELKTLQETEIFKRGTAYIESNKVLAELRTKLIKEQEVLKQIEGFEKEIKELTAKQNTLRSQIINNHLRYSSFVDNIVNKLSIDFQGLEIKVTKRTRKNELKGFVESRFNKRGSERQSFIDHIGNDYEAKTKEVCEEFLDKALNLDLDLLSNNTIDQVTTEFFNTNWFSLSYRISYQNDSFSEMSEGKKAFVILKLLLDFSKKECPILLDQPEDSLDNRAIYKELVEYIKTKKKERQIIIVTHNPNLVVGADSENVIVANQQGNNSENRNGIKFQYLNGSLESTKARDASNPIILESRGIREHVCDILEGGDDAFRKREAKYGFRTR